MRVDVRVSPDGLEGAGLGTATVLVVDVLRASTTITTALVHGAAGLVPVADPETARHRAGAAGAGTLVAGERRGEPLEGFDLGNSPLEFTRERVAGRLIVFTTSNGTRALLAARAARAVGVAAFVNLSAAAAWAAAEGADVVVVCAGDRGGRALEDEICAGMLADRLHATRAGAVLTAAAAEAARASRAYAGRLADLAEDAPWARRLRAAGRAADLAACLTLDAYPLVPRYRPDVDKIVGGP